MNQEKKDCYFVDETGIHCSTCYQSFKTIHDCIGHNEKINKELEQSIADLAGWIAIGIKETGHADWRSINKFIQDFQQDHHIKVMLKKLEEKN